MASQRVFQLGLRRAAVPFSSGFKPAGRMAQRRLTSTNNVEPHEGNKILEQQRVKRPVSPHLSIYKPQITWYASSLNRISGVMLSGSLYIFGLAYLAAPAMGWHLESQSMIAAVAAWPVAAKIAAKATLAFPFFFHTLNGLRHLSWDLGLGLTNKAVIRTGWGVVGLSVLSGLYYTFLG